MRWERMVIACMAGLPVLSASSAVPEFAEFEIVVKRNVFDSTREPERPQVERPQLPPQPARRPERTVTLAGVFVADERTVAVFVGTDGSCTDLTVGGELAGLTVAAVDSSGARMTVDDRELTVPVGGKLSDGGEGTWTVVGQVEQARSVEAMEQEQSTAERGDLLKRLMERRKRELEK
jgi:hypothetical protein